MSATHRPTFHTYWLAPMIFIALGLAFKTEAASDTRNAEQTKISVEDLRDPYWRKMNLVDTGRGVVQYTGDVAVPDGIVNYLENRLARIRGVGPESKVLLKTADIRLSIPNVKFSPMVVLSDSTQVAVRGNLISAPIGALLSSFEKNKSASAVFCVNVDGKDYLGSDARLFRFGAESELKDAIEMATVSLINNIETNSFTSNVACEPGWEGGQPRREE